MILIISSDLDLILYTPKVSVKRELLILIVDREEDKLAPLLFLITELVNMIWEFLEWIFEYDQNDYGIDITKDEYLPRLVLSSTSLNKEKNKSKFIKNFTSWSSGNWESINEKFGGSPGEISDDLPF